MYNKVLHYFKPYHAKTTHEVSKIFYQLKEKRRLKSIDGPEGRLRKIAKSLTALIKYERIELNYQRADEVRGYAEQLISQAVRNGPENKETMEYANFYILEKQYIHKLFKVLAPRYQDYFHNYTKMYKLPKGDGKNFYPRAVLELRGNIYPSITQKNPPEHTLLHNILLSQARKDRRAQSLAMENNAKPNSSLE